jgi:hypothetical protein
VTGPQGAQVFQEQTLIERVGWLVLAGGVNVERRRAVTAAVRVLGEKRRLGGPEQAHERLGQGARPSAAEATADADEERPTQGVGQRAHKRR